MSRFSLSLGLALLVSLLAGATLRADDEPPLPVEATPADPEYLERWTPGGDTNDPDLPYPQITEPFQAETDADWQDDRWQRTIKGPFTSHSILLPEHEVGPKVAAIDAGAGSYLLYDLEAGAVVAAVADGELKTDAMRFGLLNRPVLGGQVVFYAPHDRLWRSGARGDGVERERVDYQGLYLHGDRVLLVTQVADVEVMESPLPSNERGSAMREIEVAAHAADMWLTAASAEGIEVSADGAGAAWRDPQGTLHEVAVEGSTAGVTLELDGGDLLLHWPPAGGPSSARLRYRVDAYSSVDNSAVVVSVPSATATASTTTPVELAKLKSPGGRRWGEPLVTHGELAPDSEMPYVVDRIPPPRDNPFHALFFLAGLDFFANGDAAVCTAHGDVWIVRGLDAELKQVTWQRFATGLYQPLGLEVVDERVIVLGRDQLTRLHDENNDGEADFYESFNHDLVIHGLPHAYAMRLQRTPDGGFVFLKSGEGDHGSALLKVSADGARMDVVARGFRHPFGLGVGPNDEITAADNEGNWVPASKIDLITPGGFYGFLGSASERGDSPEPLRPLCYLPKVADNSSGGQFWHVSEQWGPYHRGGMFHFSWGRCTLHAVLQQQVGDVDQAATVELPGIKLEAGPGEAEFSPRDGQLFVVGLDGWQTAATVDGSLERIRSTGQPVMLPSSFAAYQDGIELGFDQPLEGEAVAKSESVKLEQWNYQRTATYGSYHHSVANPKRVGHDSVPIEATTLSPDGKRLFLHVASLQPVDQLQISLQLRTASGVPINAQMYATINALAARDPNRLVGQTTVVSTGVDEEGASEDEQGATAPPTREQLLAKENLVAWCIVPFDAKQRGPEERAAMLERLGIKRVAYDWREEHVPQFDEELEAYARHGIALHAFWTPVNTESPLDEPHWPRVLDLAKRHDVKPELWVMLSEGLVEPLPEETRAAHAATILAPAARAAAKQGCEIGLYNHGGWFGEPDHQIAIIEALRQGGVDNVGIVYNFHHGHEHVAEFASLAKRIAPYLLTVNVNGMRAAGPKIVSFGQGDDDGAAEVRMLDALVAAGYSGPIGILGHRAERDVEECLQEGLLGAAAAATTGAPKSTE